MGTGSDTICCRRFLAREFRWKGGKMSLAVVGRRNGNISVTPFEGETEATIFIDSIVEIRDRDGLASPGDSGAFIICTTGEDELKTITLDNCPD